MKNIIRFNTRSFGASDVIEDSLGQWGQIPLLWTNHEFLRDWAEERPTTSSSSSGARCAAKRLSASGTNSRRQATRRQSQRIVIAACLSFTEACATYKNSSCDLLCASPSLLLTDALSPCDNVSARSNILNAELFQETRSPVAFANVASLVSSCYALRFTQPELLSSEAEASASSNGNQPLWVLLLVSVFLLCFLCCGPYHQERKHAKRYRRKKKDHRHSRDWRRARDKVISRARLV